MQQFSPCKFKIAFGSPLTIRVNPGQEFYFVVDDASSSYFKEEENVKWEVKYLSNLFTMKTPEETSGGTKYSFVPNKSIEQTENSIEFLGSVSIIATSTKGILGTAIYSVFVTSKNQNVKSVVILRDPIDNQYIKLEPFQTLQVIFSNVNESYHHHHYILPSDGQHFSKGIKCELEKMSRTTVSRVIDKETDWRYSFAFTESTIDSITQQISNDTYGPVSLLFTERASKTDKASSNVTINVALTINKNARKQLKQLNSKRNQDPEYAIRSHVGKDLNWSTAHKKIGNTIILNPKSGDDLVVDDKILDNKIYFAIATPDSLLDVKSGSLWDIKFIPVASNKMSSTQRVVKVGTTSVQIFTIYFKPSNDHMDYHTKKIKLGNIELYFSLEYTIDIGLFYNTNKTNKTKNRSKNNTSSYNVSRYSYNGRHYNYIYNDPYNQVNLISQYMGDEIISPSEMIEDNQWLLDEDYEDEDDEDTKELTFSEVENLNTFDTYQFDNASLFDEDNLIPHRSKNLTNLRPDLVKKSLFKKHSSKSSLRDKINNKLQDNKEHKEPTTQEYLPVIYNPINGTVYNVKPDEVFSFSMRSPGSIYGDDYLNSLWAITVLDSNTTTKLVVIDSKSEKINKVIFQSFKIGVLHHTSSQSRIAISLGAGSKMITFYLNIVENDSTQYSMYSYQKKIEKLLDVKQVDFDGDSNVQRYVLPFEKRSDLNFYVDTHKTLEFICPLEEITDRWMVKGIRKLEHIVDISTVTYTNWEKKHFQSFIIKMKPLPHGKHIEGLSFLYNKKSFINLSIWSSIEVSYNNSVKSEICNVGNHVYLNKWRNNDTITIGLSDSLSIDLPLLRDYSKDIPSWNITIIEARLEKGFYRDVIQYTGDDSWVEDTDTLFLKGSTGILDVGMESPYMSRYMLKSVAFYQPRIFDIMECLFSQHERNVLHVFKVAFSCEVDDVLIQKLLNVSVVDEDSLQDRSFSESLNPKNNSQFVVQKDSYVAFSFVKTFKQKDTTYEVVRYPIFMTLLDQRHSQSLDQLRFYVNDTATCGEVVFKIDDCVIKVHIDIKG